MENVKLLLSQKSQLDLVEKIKNRNKNRTHASLFQSSEGRKQENFLCGLMNYLHEILRHANNICFVPSALSLSCIKTQSNTENILNFYFWVYEISFRVYCRQWFE